MKKYQIKLKLYFLHENYESFEEFVEYDKIYSISSRLGYKSAEAAWRANPKYALNLSNNKLIKVSPKDKQKKYLIFGRQN